jgi:hypothetical protein
MPDDETADFVELDLDRAERRGYPEAVLCAGKTPEQVGVIAAQLRRHRAPVHPGLGGARRRLLAKLPDARYEPDCRLLAWPPELSHRPPRAAGCS